MNKPHSASVGFLYAFVYVLCIVFSFLGIQKISHQISVYFILLTSTFLAILVFNAINISSFIKIHRLIFSDFKDWAIMTGYITLVWGLGFIAAAENAYLFVTLFFLTNALSAAVYYRHRGKSLAIGLVILAIGFLEPGYLTAKIYSIGAGIFGFSYLLTSVNFSKKHQLTATQILAIRFYPLLIFSIIMCFWFQDSINTTWTWLEVGILIILAVFNQILPNFLSQAAAHNLQVKQFSFTISFIPFLAFIGNGIMYNEWNIILCLLSLLASFVLNFDIIRSVYQNK